MIKVKRLAKILNLFDVNTLKNLIYFRYYLKKFKNLLQT